MLSVTFTEKCNGGYPTIRLTPPSNSLQTISKGAFENLSLRPLKPCGENKGVIDLSHERRLLLLEFGHNDQNLDSDREKIAKECRRLLHSGYAFPNKRVKHTIAKLIFLADRAAEKTAQIVSEGKSIDALFASEIAFRSDHDPLGLQDPALVIKTAKEHFIADALLTHSGNLNLVLIDLLKADTNLFPEGAQKHEYERDIINVLDHLKVTKELQQQFDEIVLPQNLSRVCGDIIRATTKKQEVSLLNLKRAVMTAFLSSLRQGPVGSCFATSIGIEIAQERLDFYLRDLIQLATVGKLYRKIEGELIEFPFLTKIADNDRERKIHLHDDGTITYDTKRARASEVPGVVFALKLMNIDISKIVFSELKAVGETTPEALIQELAALEESDETLGLIGFSSLTNCCLVRMWENTLAGMSEGRKESIMRGMILGSVLKAASHLLKIKGTVTKMFMKVLNENFILEFDPCIKLKGPSSDGFSTEGGFVLYSREPFVRRDSPEGFCHVVLSSLKITRERLDEKVVLPGKHKKYRTTIKKIVDFVLYNDIFVELALWHFDDENKRFESPLAHWPELTMTPWVSKMGDDPNILFQVYTQKVSPLVEKHRRPKSALDLFTFAVERARELERLDHFFADNEEEGVYLTTVRGVHAFSFIPKNPTFSGLVVSALTPGEAVQRALLPNGFVIAGAPLAEETKASMLEALEKRGYLPDGFVARGVTTYEFSQELIASVVAKTNNSEEDVIKLITNLLLSSLPKEVFSVLGEDAIIGFDTNWSSDGGGKNLYFCAFFNPATKAIDLGLTVEDKSFLVREDHNPWLTRYWEITTTTFNEIK